MGTCLEDVRSWCLGPDRGEGWDASLASVETLGGDLGSLGSRIPVDTHYSMT